MRDLTRLRFALTARSPARYAARALACALVLACGPARAEQTVTSGEGVVRVLDKLTGRVSDLDLTTGETVVLGHLSVTMGECRYPSANPSGDAYVQLVIHDSRESLPVFSGWMVASAPALNPLDHPRYDVWALRCELTDGSMPVLNLEPAPGSEPEIPPAE